MAYIELLKLHQLYEGLRQVVRVAGRECILIHEQGQTRLIQNVCPHAGAPLTQGTINNGAIRCARHGITFDLLSGQPLTAGCDQPLTFIPLSYEGNTLGVYV
jgi:nitrite reductase/ring-hydroxylating ferredoxin subunit